MDRLTPEQLMQILSQRMEWYAGYSDDSKAYFFEDTVRHRCVVTGIMNDPIHREERSFILMQARIVDDLIVIDDDTLWDKNLWQSLVKAGVPREQIILAYKGEQVPTLSE
jgi:hypothetical protein